MNQGDVIQNRYAGSSKKGRRRGFEEVPIFVQRTSASPMTAVCITTVSFTSRIGVTNKALSTTISADLRRNPT